MNQDGLPRRLIDMTLIKRAGLLLSATLVAAAGCATTTASTPSAHQAKSSGHVAVPQSTIVRNGEVWLHGKIMRDGCDQAGTRLPIGDVGCSVTVNGYTVSVVHGNTRLSGMPGTVTGLNASTDQSGSHADVYAQITGPQQATILSAPKYYARISG